MLENNNAQAGLVNTNAKIDAKAEVNTEIKGELKAADNIHTQFGGTYIDNRTIIVQGVSREEMNACIDAKICEKILLFKNEFEKVLLFNDIEKLKNNVGTITSYKEAISISTIKDDNDFDKILSSTLIERIQSEDTDEQNTYSQAISVMKNFTNSHIKIVAFLYLLESNYLKDNLNTNNFLEFYDKYITKLIDIPNSKYKELGMTIIANGAAVSYTFGDDIQRYLPSCFYDKLTGQMLDIGIEIKSKIKHLEAVWNLLSISSSLLTPIGKCIGQKYCSEILELNVIYSKDNTINVPTKEDIITKDEFNNATKNLITYEETSGTLKFNNLEV